MVNQVMAKLPLKLAEIAAEIKISGKPPSAFITTRHADGSRLCMIGGAAIRLTDNEYFAVLKAVQPAAASDPAQQAKWNLHRRAERD